MFSGVFDDDVLRAGWRAGLAAVRRDGLPGFEEAAALFRDRYYPRISAPALDEVDYPALIVELMGELGAELSDAELERFLEAEHEAEIPARHASETCHVLLDALRADGLKLGLVSNACDPGRLLRKDLEWMGLDERLDLAVFSSEVGKRKPHAGIFRAALDGLGVRPEQAVFVGDRLYEDVRGASELGMTTVLASWFRADRDPRGVPPDFEATRPDEVLEIVRGLRAARRASSASG